MTWTFLRRLGSSSAITLALGVAFSMIVGCGQEKSMARPAAVPVTVAEVVSKTVPVEIRTIGNVEAYSTVNIKPRIDGQINRVLFTEGQDVRKGQLLFTLDPSSLEASLKKAEATLLQDEAKLNNARVEAKRYNNLVGEGVIAKQQADQVETNFQALEATVNADRAQVQYDKVQLSYTKIFSPIDGRTGNLVVHNGNVVKANDAGSMMVTINQITPIYVNFSVPQQYLADIKKFWAKGKLRVEAIPPHEADNPVGGLLSFIDNTVDPATGTIKLKGTFANQERRLWPGEFLNVVLTLSRESNAIVVPQQAVQTGQEGQYVFVVKADQTAESRPVTVLRTVDGQSVIEKGLQPGEKVVTDGQIRLVSGAKVQVKGAVQAQEAQQ